MYSSHVTVCFCRVFYFEICISSINQQSTATVQLHQPVFWVNGCRSKTGDAHWGFTKCLAFVAHVFTSVSGLLGLIGISEWLNRVIQSVNKQAGLCLLAQLADPPPASWSRESDPITSESRAVRTNMLPRIQQLIQSVQNNVICQQHGISVAASPASVTIWKHPK